MILQELVNARRYWIVISKVLSLYSFIHSIGGVEDESLLVDTRAGMDLPR